MILCCLVCSTIHSPFAKTLYCYNISPFAKAGSPSLLSELSLFREKIKNTLVADSILDPAEERYTLQACPSLPSNSNFRSSLFFPPGGQDMEMWSWRCNTGYLQCNEDDTKTYCMTGQNQFPQDPRMFIFTYICLIFMASVGKGAAIQCMVWCFI